MKCPKCGGEIDHLELSVREVVSFTVTYGRSGLLVSEKFRMRDVEYPLNEYRCPLCDEVLFTSDSEAYNFLRSEYRSQRLEGRRAVRQ
jgi:transcription initiation factor IIE alpha subunit